MPKRFVTNLSFTSNTLYDNQLSIISPLLSVFFSFSVIFSPTKKYTASASEPKTDFPKRKYCLFEQRLTDLHFLVLFAST